MSECCSHVGAMSGLQRSSPGVDVRAGWLACQSHNGSSASQGRVTNKTGRLRARKMQRVRCLHLFLARPPDGAVTRHAVLDAGQFRIHLTASFHWLLWKIRLVSPVPDVSRISLLCSWILSRTEGKKESEQERKRARESERASEGGKTRRAKSSPRKQLLSGRERERDRERGDLSSLELAAGIFGGPLGSGTFAVAACKDEDVEFGFSQCVDCACGLAAGIFGLPIGTACQSREDTQECRCRLALIAHLRLGDLCHRRSGSLSTEDADENAFVLLVVHLRIGDFRCRRTRRLSREDAA